MLIVHLAIVLFLLGERQAYAYVDPGTGSLLFQTALTVIVGLGLVVRRVRSSIVDFVKRLGGRQPSSGPVDSQQH